MTRWAMGVRYNGSAYEGWQSQRSGRTVQDQLEKALGRFTAQARIGTLCAGRTDAGVHGWMQVVHFDTDIVRESVSWVRGTNRFLPPDIAVQWAQPMSDTFHCRTSAEGRRYLYVLSQSPVRPSLDAGRIGWSMYALDGEAMRAAALYLLGEHDFSSFRAAACQSHTPIKQMRRIEITRIGQGERCRWHFEFEANAFLHHMIRNIMGCLVRVGRGDASPEWVRQVLEAGDRTAGAPTFAADGLYFLGPLYSAHWGLPAELTAGAVRAAYDGPP